MSFSERRGIQILFILLIYIGQSVAFAVTPCQKDMQNQPDTMAMEVMDHSAHLMNDNPDTHDEASKSVSSDCCNLNCNCSISGCVSVALPPTSQHVGEFIVSSLKLSQCLSLVTNQGSDSLYRPPIPR